jgi:hypothetical protein
MHDAAFVFVERAVAEHGPFTTVIEIGSRDINGSVRGLFSDSTSYTGLDLVEGPLVDWVGDAEQYEPEAPVDCVVACEVYEHTPRWAKLTEAAAGWLAPGGTLIVTCAGPGRSPHSSSDGRHRLLDGEHYANIGPDELATIIEGVGLTVLSCESKGWDTRALAIRRL